MIINKEVVILGKTYNLIYHSFVNSKPNSRASLKILFGKVHIVSLYVIRHGLILVNGNNKRTNARTVLEAKRLILKLLTNS